MARGKSSQAASAPRIAHPGEAPRSLIWLQGLVCGAVVTLATASAVLAGGLLAPAVLAYWLDRQPGQPVARAVLVCTLAGAIQPLVMLWQGGHSVTLALALLSDTRTVMQAWGAGAGGWILAELVPVGARVALDLVAVARATRLRAQRTQLEREWGIPPAEPGA